MVTDRPRKGRSRPARTAAAVDVAALRRPFGTLHLGTPAGTCTIRLSSVKELELIRPAGVPVRVEIARGCTQFALDERRFGAVGNGLADQTDGYNETTDRYLVLVARGVDGLTVKGLRG